MAKHKASKKYYLSACKPIDKSTRLCFVLLKAYTAKEAMDSAIDCLHYSNGLVWEVMEITSISRAKAETLASKDDLEKDILFLNPKKNKTVYALEKAFASRS